MTQYYLAIDSKRTGPFSLEELEEQNIQPDSLVWTEGMPDWAEARNFPELNALLVDAPPVLPYLESNASRYSQNVPPKPTQYFGYELAGMGDRLAGNILQGFIIAFIAFILFYPATWLWHIDYRHMPHQRLVSWLFGISGSLFIGAICYPLWSGNVGHKLMGLKVISAIDGTEFRSAFPGAAREILKSILGPLGFPDMWLLWDANRQNLYDKVVKTYVVKVKN